MRNVRTKNFPWGKYISICIWPFIFYKGNLSEITENHELIHAEQQKELLLIGFYILYLLFHLRYGYKNNPFEREAYDNDGDSKYLKNRESYFWIKYIKYESNRIL